MSELKGLSEQLKDANAELHHARGEFFKRANKESYSMYYKALLKVNKLEEQLGCKVEDISLIVGNAKKYKL